MTEEQTLTLEAVQALEAQIKEAQKQKDQFELTRLQAVLDYMEGEEFTAVMDKLQELSDGSLNGGHAYLATYNMKAGLEKAKNDITQRAMLLGHQMNPAAAIPMIPIIPVDSATVTPGT